MTRRRGQGAATVFYSNLVNKNAMNLGDVLVRRRDVGLKHRHRSAGCKRTTLLAAGSLPCRSLPRYSMLYGMGLPVYTPVHVDGVVHPRQRWRRLPRRHIRTGGKTRGRDLSGRMQAHVGKSPTQTNQSRAPGPPPGHRAGPASGLRPPDHQTGHVPGQRAPADRRPNTWTRPPWVQRHHSGTGTAPAPAHGRLKVSNRRHPAGCAEGRTVPPSTYGGRLKVSGRANPAGRNNTATALWEQLRRHG